MAVGWQRHRFPLYRRLGGPQGRSGRVRKASPHRESFLFSCSLFICCPYSFLLFNCSAFFLFTVQQTSIPPAGFKPAIPASDRPQTLALDRSATGIGGFDPRTTQPLTSRYTDWAMTAQFTKIYKMKNKNCSNLCTVHTAYGLSPVLW